MLKLIFIPFLPYILQVRVSSLRCGSRHSLQLYFCHPGDILDSVTFYKKKQLRWAMRGVAETGDETRDKVIGEDRVWTVQVVTALWFCMRPAADYAR